jgi:hypothetical protein
MKWIDYRERLGVGFDDETKFKRLKKKTDVMFDLLYEQSQSHDIIVYSFMPYYFMVGESPLDYDYKSIGNIFRSINNESEICGFLSKFIALINTAESCFYEKDVKQSLQQYLLDFLGDLDIPYELVTDDDGIFIFPKGVPEFDDALVSAPLDWLKDYPNAEKAWSKALREYAEVKTENASDVADLFRKALEAFFQEVFGGGKSLENYKSEYGSFLKANGVPQEIANNFVTLLDSFTKYNNKYAKHHDKAELNILEYLMYQTGNIVRLVITLKQEEA